MKKQLLEDVGGFDEEIYYGSDVELIFRLACHAKGGRVGEVLTNRRSRLNSMSTNVDKKCLLAPKVFDKMLTYQGARFGRHRALAMHNLHRYLASHVLGRESL